SPQGSRELSCLRSPAYAGDQHAQFLGPASCWRWPPFLSGAAELPEAAPLCVALSTESSIRVPLSRWTLRPAELMTEPLPLALPAVACCRLRSWSPKTPWLEEANMPLAFKPPLAPGAGVSAS